MLAKGPFIGFGLSRKIHTQQDMNDFANDDGRLHQERGRRREASSSYSNESSHCSSSGDSARSRSRRRRHKRSRSKNDRSDHSSSRNKHRKTKRKSSTYKESDTEDDDDSCSSSSSRRRSRRRRRRRRRKRHKHEKKSKTHSQLRRCADMAVTTPETARYEDASNPSEIERLAKNALDYAAHPSSSLNLPHPSSLSPPPPPSPRALPPQRVPLTREQYEREQRQLHDTIERIVLPDGRVRMVRGTGEVVETLVTKSQHAALNQQATRGDAADFFAQSIHAAAAAKRK
jgi:Nuclear RNA-splicing-associated protein